MVGPLVIADCVYGGGDEFKVAGTPDRRLA
jgi:hypothetical protein